MSCALPNAQSGGEPSRTFSFTLPSLRGTGGCLSPSILLLASLLPLGCHKDPANNRSTFPFEGKNSEALVRFLETPFDLQAFKQKKQCHSNSGGGEKGAHLYRPLYPGFYYEYFVFDCFGESGPDIVTFKKGLEIGRCMDPSEVIIEVSSDWPDPDLGSFDLVGEDESLLLLRFGSNYLRKDFFFVYQQGCSILILRIIKDKVVWFKVSKLAKPISSFAEVEIVKDLIPEHVRRRVFLNPLPKNSLPPCQYFKTPHPVIWTNVP